MISYKQLTKKTMPPEKKAKASRCVVGHYLVRPISNIASIPLIEAKVDPTKVTIFSALFPILALLFFGAMSTRTGFLLGWLCILIWNILDGIDGNIARYNDCCSLKGELWDATVGWMAVIAFYMGMGFEAFYNPGNTFISLDIPKHIYLFMGCASAMAWIFPRLVMQKKNVLFGEKSVKEVKDRANYGFLKLLFFNVTSVNGLAAVIFMVCYFLNLMGVCMIGYTIISMLVAIGSLYTLLLKKE